ncbi:hypothetical protein [Massilia frigida]|nr:hypothetical protein [Massilia frigida]
MPMGALRYPLALLVLAMSSGCAVVAVTGAVVSAGVAVGSAAVSTGVAVTKGAVKVATYPFRDSDEEKAAKAKAEAQDKD